MIAAIVAAVLLVLFFVFRPSPYSKVKNLSSHGTNVIAFGDSLTAGYGAKEGEDFPSKLSSTIHLPIINGGISGDTTEMALARIDRDVTSKDPRIVLVGLGGNDYLRGIPITATEQNLRSVIQKLQGSGAMVVLLGFRFPSLTANYDEMYARVAKEEGCLLVPDMLDQILSNPSLKSDEIHPNANGYALMAQRLDKPVQKLIEAANGAKR